LTTEDRRSPKARRDSPKACGGRSVASNEGRGAALLYEVSAMRRGLQQGYHGLVEV
jgi:hypothetical protein